MSDLIGIGVSGLSAYQRALATTSNNIANLQTEGYVRQRAVLASSGQDPNATISIGTGVRFAEVQRLYDRFAEENLQRASSTLESEESMLKELQALQDAIGSSEVGLHGAFQDFFDGARELEAAPSSAGARAGFLAKAEGLAARFRGLAETAINLDNDSRAQIDQALAEANTLLTEIASLNKQLLKRTSASEQPMQLLDQRDAALRELSKKIGVTIVLGSSGDASVYAGDTASGAALVEGGDSRTISATFDDYDFGRSEFVLDAASRPVVIPGIKTGLIGGLLGFRREGLGLTINKLDELALSFGRVVNKLHREGLDYSGRPGEDLFYIGPDFRVDGRANGGGSRLGVTVLDAEAIKSASYEMRFSASTNSWEIREIASGRSVTGGTPLQLDGLEFTVEGTPRDGDTFRIAPSNHPSATFTTLIKDGSQVASAGRFAVRASSANLGATTAEMTMTSPRESANIRSITDVLPSPKLPVGEESFVPSDAIVYQDTVIAARTGPIAVIPAGYSKIALSTAIGEGSELAVFTRDGRQISGPRIASLASSIVTETYGFYAGATYSDAYLNESGTDAYLDLDFSRGLYAESGLQRDVDGKSILTPATIYGEKVTLTSFETQTLLINGHSVPVTDAQGASPSAVLASVIDDLNVYRGLTGVTARAVDDRLILSTHNEIAFDIDKINVDMQDRVSVNINDGDYTVGFRLRINADDINVNQNFVTINGEKIYFDSLEDLEAQINGSGTLQLQAQIEDDELIVTVNADNSRIKIGSNSIGLKERDDLYLRDDDELDYVKASQKLVELINAARTGLVATDGLRVTIDSLEISSTGNAGIYDISRTVGAGDFVNVRAGDVIKISSGTIDPSVKNRDLLVLEVLDNGNTIRTQAIDGGALVDGVGENCTIDRAVQITNTPRGSLVTAPFTLAISQPDITVPDVYDLVGASQTFSGYRVGDVVSITGGAVSADSKNKALLVLAVSADEGTLTCRALDGSALVIEADRADCIVERESRDGIVGTPITIGSNTLALDEGTFFNDATIKLDIVSDTDSSSDERAAFGSLGFRSGFVMNDALAEDLLVFGVNKDGGATKISLSGTYKVGDPSPEMQSGSRTYSLQFAGGNFRLVDTATTTEVVSGTFDTTTRTIRYANWAVTLKTIPSDGDTFTILKNDDASGDNRIASLIANLQFDRTMLASKQTVQQDYEDLVNKVGVLTVQAEIGRDAQRIVFTQARENRDRISGVNLDEELSDLLRYQQAYQANAQVIQTASRLFDTLMQRL